jgi:hypothetical protein
VIDAQPSLRIIYELVHHLLPRRYAVAHEDPVDRGKKYGVAADAVAIGQAFLVESRAPPEC